MMALNLHDNATKTEKLLRHEWMQGSVITALESVPSFRPIPRWTRCLESRKIKGLCPNQVGIQRRLSGYDKTGT